MQALKWQQLYQITKRIRPSKKRFNTENFNENRCFKWCLTRHLNPADHHPARIRKVDKDFAKELDFKDIKFPIKIKYIHKIEKKELYQPYGFWLWNKEKYPIYMLKNTFKRHVDLLLIQKEGKSHYVLIK